MKEDYLNLVVFIKKDNFKDKQNMGDLPNNYCYIDIDDKMFNIKQVYKLLSLMINNESNINKTVITVTGKYGERGYSFTSDDYGDNSFHLTDQYYRIMLKIKIVRICLAETKITRVIKIIQI